MNICQKKNAHCVDVNVDKSKEGRIHWMNDDDALFKFVPTVGLAIDKMGAVAFEIDDVVICWKFAL